MESMKMGGSETLVGLKIPVKFIFIRPLIIIQNLPLLWDFFPLSKTGSCRIKIS